MATRARVIIAVHGVEELREQLLGISEQAPDAGMEGWRVER